jgi:hypothetical protein
MRSWSVAVSSALAVAWLTSVPVAGQSATDGSKKPVTTATTGTSSRTPWGDPDLQGMWLGATITPFERPVALGNKAYWTEEEVAALEKQSAENRVDRAPRKGDTGAYNQFWLDSGTKVVSSRQTSLVVEPPNGRVPAKPEAEAKRDYNLQHNGDSWVHMSVWDRCITRGVPGGMFPAGYNNAYQILQTPGAVVILYEMIHEARIIPMDGRPHVGQTIRLWNGDSRGRWEGQTLVVETTNYSDKGWVASSAATGRVKGIPQTEALHVVERFSRTNANTLQYEVTVTDPNIYTQPWKVSIPLERDPGYQIFEYACHEGNTAVSIILSGARAQERAATR